MEPQVEKATEAEIQSVRDEMASLRGARLGGMGRTGEAGAKSFASAVWGDVFKMVGDKEVYKEPVDMAYKPYLQLDVKNYKFQWKTTGLEKAFNDISRHICCEIAAEFSLYVEQGHSPGVSSTSKYPAVARGKEDMDSLINALEIRRTINGWGIVVVNKVWLYQEYGFDMKGRLPPREVAIKILQWAFQKGIVFHDNDGGFEARERGTHKARRKGRYGYTTVDEKERLLDWNNYEASAVWGDNKALDKFMWKLTQAVVRNSSGRMNRRLFLTTAYRSVVEDKARILGIMRDVMKSHGF